VKKTFKLTDPKIKTARMVESVKHQVKKYFKRERNKELPSGADFWDFDCKFADKEDNAINVDAADINKLLSAAEAQKLESVYIEILAKPGVKKPREDEEIIDDFLEETEETEEQQQEQQQEQE